MGGAGIAVGSVRSKPRLPAAGDGRGMMRARYAVVAVAGLFALVGTASCGKSVIAQPAVAIDYDDIKIICFIIGYCHCS